MEFRTVADMVQYFGDVEKRIADGTFNPTRPQWETEVARLVRSIEEVRGLFARHITERTLCAEQLLHLGDTIAMLTQLLGKMKGFRRGIDFLIARAGSGGEYLV
jgi:hypothetical protein